jgi:hypothetical protein
MGLSLGLNLSAGYVPIWEPSELSSLIHWYRLGVGQTSDDNGITAWNDQKGSNNLTADGGATEQPNLVNGAIFFNNNDDHLAFGTALELGKFSVYIRAEHQAANDFITAEASSGGTDFLKVQNTTQARIKINGARHDFSLNITLSNDVKYSIGFERDADGDLGVFGEQGSNVINFNVAGASPNDGNQPISDLTDFVEIGRPAVGLTIYEIVVLNDSLDATNRALLLDYLSSK